MLLDAFGEAIGGAIGEAVGLAVWAYLLGLETDVVGVLRNDPDEALLPLAFTLTPIAGGGFVLRDVLRRGPGAVCAGEPVPPERSTTRAGS